MLENLLYYSLMKDGETGEKGREEGGKREEEGHIECDCVERLASPQWLSLLRCKSRVSLRHPEAGKLASTAPNPFLHSDPHRLPSA